MAKHLIHLGKWARVSMSIIRSLMLGTLVFGAFYASISLLQNVNQPLATCGSAVGNRACKHRKTLSNFILGAKQPSLTIFTAPTRPFSNSSNDPQYQALLSWLSLDPAPKIVLLGRDPSIYKVSEELCDEVSVEPHVDYNLWGTPQVHSIFARAQQAKTDISMVINTQTLLFQDFIEALHKTYQDHQEWVLFGKPRDVNPKDYGFCFTRTGAPGLADIASTCPMNCKETTDLVISHGSLQGPVSYWAWNNDDKKKDSLKPLLTTPIPPFSYLVGTFEEWILQHLIKEPQLRVIIDASEIVTGIRMASATTASTLSASWEEAHINAMLHRGSNSDVTSTSIAPWQLIQRTEPKVHNLSLVEQKEQFSSVKNDRSGHLPHDFTELQHHDNFNSNDTNLEKKEQHTLDALLPKVADKNKVAVMVGGTSNYKEMLLSFICRAQSLGIQNVLIAAFDEALYEYAHMQGLPVYLENSSEDYKSSIGSDGQCIFASECFKRVSKLKSMSVLRVLKKGYSVLWSDMDIVWFENPLPQLLAFGFNTLPIQSDEPDEHLPENNILGANSGFYLARAEEKTIHAFEAIVKHAMKSDTTEQPSFYNILCGEKGERRVGDRECVIEENGLRSIFLSRKTYPNGYVYGHWETSDASKSCKKKGCVLLHNNFIAGKENKLVRFVMHKLWFYDVSNRMCMHPWHVMRNAHIDPSTFQAHFLAVLNISHPAGGLN